MIPTSLSERDHIEILSAMDKSDKTTDSINGIVMEFANMDTDFLLYLLELANNNYRHGNPFVSDKFYDFFMLGALREKYPNHPFLNSVEPEEELVAGKTVDLPQRMLSTDKAYTMEEIKKWTDRVIAAATQLGISAQNIQIEVSPKLDGYAGYDDGEKLYTRGNGYRGTDISRAFERGVTASVRGQGPGEIVVNSAYFKEVLSDKYENSRNILAGVIKEGELDPSIVCALNDQAVQFVPFTTLDSYIGNIYTILENFEQIRSQLLDSVIFDTDGIVIEVVDQKIKDLMGSTNHHHRWQIAFKINSEFADIVVLSVTPQTSKYGVITPVAELTPTVVSGATLSRATCHNYGNVISSGIDTGAVVRVFRSGLVIPYIESVITPAECVKVPQFCPSCGHVTNMDGDKLICTNTATCPAQIEGKLEFFFKTIGTCDGFGPKVIEKIVDYGIESVSDIYECSVDDLVLAGISRGVAANLIVALGNSLKIQIEDWRFLAAFSIPGIGKGGCEKLLQNYKLSEIFDLWSEDIIAIDGFGEKSATSLIGSLTQMRDEIEFLATFFNLKESFIDIKGVVNSDNISPIFGRLVVFTGAMQYGVRKDMEANAKSLGATVGSSVSSKTDYLICGDKVGANKTEAAKKNGTTILTESEYNELIGDWSRAV